MCFTKFLREAEITTEDKPCMKILIKDENGNYVSSVKRFKYEVGVTYECNEIPLEELENKSKLDEGVFHSFSQISIKDLALIRDHNRQCIADNMLFNCIYPAYCLIPKGTPYWFNPFNHVYASTKIKINNLVDLENLPITE